MRELAVVLVVVPRAAIGCLLVASYVSFLRRQVLGSLMLEFTTWFGPSRTRLLVLILQVFEQQLCLVQVLMTKGPLRGL